eukprot:IDg15744t1
MHRTATEMYFKQYTVVAPLKEALKGWQSEVTGVKISQLSESEFNLGDEGNARLGISYKKARADDADSLVCADLSSSSSTATSRRYKVQRVEVEGRAGF